MEAAAPGKAIIVGAGLAGSLMTVYLARRGWSVEVYERRPDMRREPVPGGRSINLGLSKRGIQALTEVGLVDRVLARAVAMRGRVIHGPGGDLAFQPYGKGSAEVLHSIDRNQLNVDLMDLAETFPGVRLFFEHRFVTLDKAARTVELRREGSGETVRAVADLLIGADGAFSKVRQELQRGERAAYQQEFLEWGYKELTLPPRPDGASAIEHHALHVWPRGHCLIVSHANRDGSHTCTLFLPFDGPGSFAEVRTDADVAALFRRFFPDLLPLVPDLAEQWTRHPVGSLVTTRTSPWHWHGWAVLIGDACHAVYPFYGQGMNAAFEDCSVLDRCLALNPGDRRAAFAAYQERRKRHTDTLAELSKENFLELRQKVRSPLFVARKRADILLNRLFPRTWLPLYSMISHSTMPYADALARARRQNRLLAVGAAGMAGLLLLGGAALALLSP